ncbi:l,D-transpeptidase YcbB [Flavobacterium akiainvivens]|uniref:L,D-transpeptidase YcbB n=1 Tax=Flavobacterium akiainvivens TaxID=1202724 RepID=A0A0M9VH38_9FLAO|nr:L,D-transpeptidase family protein [Flavobacterium akiainvivens]KOS05152.1 l,D-transpeptidase YcbB [Flavobacterium akiainvivens]SFQ51089.1 Murein L,D-transpeptidase YcbB/YkuD [Flavobacterium akiainvivens]
MKKLPLIFALFMGIVLTTTSCKKKDDNKQEEATANTEVHDHDQVIPIDKGQFAAFFTKYPDLKAYEDQINELYEKHDHYIWHEKRGFIEFAEVLYNRVNQIGADGLPTKVPYKAKLDELFTDSGRGDKANVDSELLISAMYFYYTDKVIGGLDAEKSKQTGWFLPREKMDYVAYLDTLMRNPKKINADKDEMFSQYYNLKKGLQKYQDIKKKGGWATITWPDGTKAINPGDSSATVQQIRARLAAEGFIKSDNKSGVYDDELKNGVAEYEKRHFREFNGKITELIVKELNISVDDRIKAITVNMERCRWVTPAIDKQQEYIAVNIPSYRLRYVKDGKIFMTSNVVVGKELNKTVIFSGEMSYLVFAPYWNIPKSILEKEIKPGIAKNSNYLANHNMEYYNNGKSVRQKPGGQNSLGLVKFMFPNTNNIYLHDTPAKSLFNKDDRAFSHGCVRVQKARDLAIAITKDQAGWSESKVDAAMKGSKETYFNLKRKIPVYLTYFTAWADENGNVAFFDDVYKRDESLAHLLYNE